MSKIGRVFLVAGLAAGLGSPAAGQVLFDNGPLATTPTGVCIPAGAAASEVQAGNVVIGFGVGALFGERGADDFTISNPTGWNLIGLDFSTYQTGSTPAASPIASVNVQIWNGRPGDVGATVVAGDATTNRLVSSVFAGVYRYPSGQCATTRPVFLATASLPVTLPPGTYWVDWQIGGDPLLAGPFAPPTTYTGFRSPQPPHAPGNARKFNGTAWVDATDPTVGGLAQDFPFRVKGTIVGAASGACCIIDGSCVIANAAGCAAQGGTYHGDGSTCGTIVCPQPGACCLPNFTCQVMTAAQCGSAGGVYRGDGVTCALANCDPPPTGACCRLDGTCAALGSAACTSIGGIYRGDNSACAGADCPVAFVQNSNIAIPDGGAINGTAGANATATIVVTTPGTIRDLDVNFVINHGWQGDLAVRLVTPAGQTIELVGRPGVTPPKYSPGVTLTYGFPTDNYGTTTLPFIADDGAAGVYDNLAGFPGPPPGSASATDNVGGRWRPVQTLAGLNGTPTQGTWRLVVNDYAAGDTGSIARFGLHFAVGCYANCDNSTGSPLLNVNDFICFQSRFAAGDAYANCDGSSTPPVLNVNDFVCYQSLFVAGCTAP